MKTQANKIGAALLAVTGLLTGCAATAPEAERNFGSSVRAAVAAQTADPSAAANATPVMGLDGAAAKASHMNYERSYAKPPEPQHSMTTGSGK